MSIKHITISVTDATSGSGTSTATATSDEVVNGIIKSIHLQGVGTPPNTLDVTIAGAGSPSMPILSIGNIDIGADDGAGLWYHVKHEAADSSDGTALSNHGADVVINDKITVTIDDVNEDDGLTATIYYA